MSGGEYIVDVLIAMKGKYRKVMAALSLAGLTPKSAKCAWGRKYVQHLGHIVDNVGKTVVTPRSLRSTTVDLDQLPFQPIESVFQETAF